MLKRSWLAGLVTLLVALASCTSSGNATSIGDAGGDGSAEDGSDAAADAAAECSTGPTYDRGFQDYEKANDSKTYSQCTPHCGYTGGKLGGLFYADALPSGACSGVGSPCGMPLGVSCCGQTNIASGIVHEMRCDCIDGNWKCIIIQQGGGACECEDAAVGD